MIKIAVNKIMREVKIVKCEKKMSNIIEETNEKCRVCRWLEETSWQ